jgi:transketolase|tara:strand:+ start:1367 stop:2299 length:933 start_codon:yes stop_codon:yes gene_type:complete
MIDMRDAFFNRLYDYVSKDKNVLVLTADHGAFGLKKIEKDFPEQYLNVGIAEQTLISLAAGLASCGKKVYVYAINNFVSLRVLEQVNVDICAMNLDVNIIGVGAGFTYSTDGPTHHGVQDVAAMINLPRLHVYNATDDINTKKLVDLSYLNKHPKYFRIEKGLLPRLYSEEDDINLGVKQLETTTSDTIVFSSGFMTHTTQNVINTIKQNGIDVSHCDLFCLNPLPEQNILNLCENKRVIVVEENIKSGGIGQKLFSLLKENGHKKDVLNISLDNDFYFSFGDRNLLHKVTHLDESSINQKITDFIKKAV